MKTVIARLSDNSDANNLIFNEAGQLLREGGLVAFPTETVYGLGANALDEGASSKIYAAKGRPSDNPLIVHLSCVEDASKYCIVPEQFYKIADAFMPGPITVVMKKKDIIPDTVTGGLDTVAIRIPASEYARKLISSAGVPIAAPSANISGKPSPTLAAHVIEDMNGRIDMIIDGGSSKIGVESTIIKLIGDKIVLLRPGGITVEMLSLFGEVIFDKSIIGKLDISESPEAPGMKYRHYAPNTPVKILVGSDDKIFDFITDKSKNDKIGVLAFEKDRAKIEKIGVVVLSLGDNSDESASHELFSKLREADKYNLNAVYVKAPDKKGIGLALYNRILKAAGHEIIYL